MTLENSKVRRIILVEHEGLRIGLRALDGVLEQVALGEVSALKSAQEQVQALLQTFIRHVEHEERILRPILETVDAWGAARVKSMDEEHAEQRKVVSRLAELDPVSDPAAWARQVRTFGDELLRDMADEEKTCLSPDVLRDDIVSVHGDSE
ncbi:MAG: hemerythrin domain-containing protein [Myxococcales bacterium]|nr:hemerythrin domain-containing protein [Myxococcales bacterium]